MNSRRCIIALLTILVIAFSGVGLRAAPPEKWQTDVPFSCPVAIDGSIDASAAKLGKELALSSSQLAQLKESMHRRAEMVKRGIAASEKDFAAAVLRVLAPAQVGKLDLQLLPRQSADDVVRKLGGLNPEQKEQVAALALIRRRETWHVIVAAQKAYSAATAVTLKPEQQVNLVEMEASDPVLRIPNH